MPYNQKSGITRIIKGALPSATRETLISLATLLAERSEWDEDRNRLLVGLADVGVVSERFADEQAAATKERDKKREKATGVGETKALDIDAADATVTETRKALARTVADRTSPHERIDIEGACSTHAEPGDQNDFAFEYDQGHADRDDHHLHHHVDTSDYRDGHA